MEWRLEQRAQRLSEAELGALLAHDGARSPRWLLRASERLRRSARFEELREEIAAVAATEAALLESELEEVEEAAGGGAARAVLTALALAAEGLTAARRLASLASDAQWAAARLALTPFLATARAAAGSDRLHLSDRAVRAAVERRYALGGDGRAAAAAWLGDSLLEWCRDAAAAAAPPMGARGGHPTARCGRALRYRAA